MELSSLEIRILFRCQKALLQKKYISQYYARYSSSERKKAINTLIEKGLVISMQLPKPDVKKKPTLYKITKKGNSWIANYKKNYPAT